jgi:hypothetical protein
VESKPGSSIYTLGAAETEEEPRQQAAIGAFIKVRGRNQDIVAVKVPYTTKLGPEVWHTITAVCNGETGDLIGFAVVDVQATNTAYVTAYVWIISLAVLVLLWLAITRAAWQLNDEKLKRVWRDAHSTEPANRAALPQLLWTFANAANPIFISQDSFGYGSLSRFQILLFTSVVGVVLLHIFITSGQLSPLSETILLLLGITVSGGVLARAVTSEWAALSPQSRRLLLGEKLLRTRRDMPYLSDLFETQGEIDVAKVQALLFTSLVAIIILYKGIGGLEKVQIPQEYIALLLISQAAYVIGGSRFLPADTRKSIERDLEQLRAAATNFLNAPNDERARNLFDQAKRAASLTLEQTYLERFDAEKFNQLAANQF